MTALLPPPYCRSPVTLTQYIGYGLAFLAVAYYNYTKYQSAISEKARQGEPAQVKLEEKASLLPPKQEPKEGTS